ncbi:hypothetical protein JOD64_005430 [Micromonospora luteifusca]|uniref:Uncharacterized protein n=1 Tax=Micromonospora luteifusca TaxID=709860 RepID=A0ABS2M193_9ACTN|nr:hypothetical protein [Micromonospora luteifusca]
MDGKVTTRTMIRVLGEATEPAACSRMMRRLTVRHV